MVMWCLAIRSGSNNQIRSLSNTLNSHQPRSGFFSGNQNASKLLEKYTSLAKEALSIGDKVLSENYSQHADHFARIISEKNSNQSISKDSVVSSSKQDSPISSDEKNTNRLAKEENI